MRLETIRPTLEWPHTKLNHDQTVNQDKESDSKHTQIKDTTNKKDIRTTRDI